MTDKILKLAKANFANDAKFSCKWHGYDVYDLIYNKPVCLGQPLVILVKNDTVRMTTIEEAYELFYEQIAAEKVNY